MIYPWIENLRQVQDHQNMKMEKEKEVLELTHDLVYQCHCLRFCLIGRLKRC
uniref:Alternative protein DMXL2 n=1 Tax=Homo sapiens TaxID=9606 RepID=L8ECF9_HUMAN|nr:alternative protein DMXL2 [Homo sapiens]